MKPLGPIPSFYQAVDGELSVDGQKVRKIAEQAGRTPIFIYSRVAIQQRISRLRKALPKRTDINYAIKANSYAPLLEMMSGLVDGFDIASGGELAMAQQAGLEASRISFAGPGKRDDELEAAIAAGATLNLESEGEAARAIAIGRRLGAQPRLAIRVNPEFELKGSGMKMGGGAKPFGVDAERVPALARDIIAQGADWRGLHIFTGSQALDADAIIEAQANVLSLASEIASRIGTSLPKLNMGGGFGIPYFHGDKPLDVERIGAALSSRMAALPQNLAATELCVELGRYLVGEAGIYVTRIVDRKISHGETYLVTDGGLHHQLAASGNFGTVVRRNYPLAVVKAFGAEPAEIANVVGCLCTPLDRLADRAHLPRADVGDLVAVFCAGAYGASASPSAFLGQGPAAEVLV
ncbi:pyridoxal-dependent decarboxylase, exosortase A system-associated [Altererythrobacter sp. SALINAS58]|uniref:pyridoxal-dependent decarboxylase, exosortase A system-associated n=1 Tax=Alteripontixanthobacter muriae TaxID=2705546 RepID=UPI0015754BC0|nr:pyridoxal-dependent decarboxylase, exosortase A system-associated [Alteripontixanthobacter muriae]NTZ41930.1 pyridoxal-dependent decarboxylase, exosortase A system-associated [Alteripontixanthobacter muriae]